MKNLKIAYLYPAYSNKSGDYTDLLDERVGDGQGNFHWLNENNKNWYIDTQENPDLLFFNGKYYKYGKDGHRKSTLNSLELINKPVETTNEQPLYDLKTWFEDQEEENLIYYGNNGKDVEIQLYGMSIYLKPDGTYFLNDTTGG